MPNIANILKSEIQRLAKREVKAATTPLHKLITSLRKDVSSLKKELKVVKSAKATTAKAVKAEAMASGEATTTTLVRPTSKTVIALRNKFGMSQSEFGQLLNVGRITVARWEAQEGKLNLRQSARDAFASVQKLGAKAARAQLEAQN